MFTVSPVLLVLLGIPAMLGLLVLLRIGRNAFKVMATLGQTRRAQRGVNNPIVPLLDEPKPCPTCTRLDLVSVVRSDFQQMPYVEHFLCRACGTAFLGPNQEAQVAKRLEAKRKVDDILSGRKLKAVSVSKLDKT